MTTVPEFHTLVNPTEMRRYYFAVDRTTNKVTITRVWLSDGERENMGTYPIEDARKLWQTLVETDGFMGEA